MQTPQTAEPSPLEAEKTPSQPSEPESLPQNLPQCPSKNGRWLTSLIKMLLIALLFGFLFWRATQNNVWDYFFQTPKVFRLLFCGLLFNLLATLLTMVRWCWLVRAQNFDFSYTAAFRLGFIGFFFNLSPVGIVGGDVIRAYLLKKSLNSALRSPDLSARQKNKLSPKTPSFPTKASLAGCFSSVIFDRILGLYGMFLLGLGVIVAQSHALWQAKEIQVILILLLSFTLVTTLGWIFLFFSSNQKKWPHRFLRKIPWIGPSLLNLFNEMERFRAQKRVLFFSLLITFVVHLCFAMSLFCLARGLFPCVPNIEDHIILYSSANMGSMIPLSAGPMEYFLDLLYPLFQTDLVRQSCPNMGLLVGTTFRIATILVALIGMMGYLSAKREIQTVLKQNQEAGKGDID